MLRAVTFDFWGTLYQGVSGQEERIRLLEAALADHGQPRPWAALEAAYERGSDVFRRLWLEESRPLTTERRVREMLAFLDAQLPEETLEGFYRRFEEVLLHTHSPWTVSGVTAVIPRLSRRYRLGLISDVGLTPGRVLREFLRRDGLLSHFGALTFSDEVGATKPRAEVFLRTLATLDARPEEAAHVGDLPETDLRGARTAGMRAILFLGVSHRDDGRPMADAVFQEYGELEELLDRLGGAQGSQMEDASA